MTAFTVEPHPIPFEPGQAVTRGWGDETGGRPLGVTWHWTATRDLAECRRLLGGANALRKGVASAHLAIGRSYAEGADQYVAMGDRAWHAGKEQTLRCDGGRFDGEAWKGSRTTIGIETVALGYERDGVPAGPDWIAVDAPDGTPLRVEPWTEEQIAMAIALGRGIQARWPHLRPEDHHGHVDLCPTYKRDPLGFPFARVLRGIYDDPTIPDVWTPYLKSRARRRALAALGLLVPPEEGNASWGPHAVAALRRFQEAEGLVVDGLWTVFVARRVHARLGGVLTPNPSP